jgi:hypothetical protein
MYRRDIPVPSGPDAQAASSPIAGLSQIGFIAMIAGVAGAVILLVAAGIAAMVVVRRRRSSQSKPGSGRVFNWRPRGTEMETKADRSSPVQMQSLDDASDLPCEGSQSTEAPDVEQPGAAPRPKNLDLLRVQGINGSRVSVDVNLIKATLGGPMSPMSAS